MAVKTLFVVSKVQLIVKTIKKNTLKRVISIFFKIPQMRTIDHDMPQLYFVVKVSCIKMISRA